MSKTSDFIANKQEIDRAWDWLTALSPLALMMVVNYRYAAVWAVLCAAVGYLAVSALWSLAKSAVFHPAPALVCGVLVACCLPAAAPAWVALAAGAIGGVVGGIPALCNRWLKKRPLSCPVYLPALTGYLAVRYLFADRLAEHVLPRLFPAVDTVAGSTPLASIGESISQERLSRMFWGFDVGSMGNGPMLAILLGGAYLLLRRRVIPVAPLAMLATVAVVFYGCGISPAFGLLAGGTLLASLLLGEGVLVQVRWKGQFCAGLLAGLTVAVCRLGWGADGAAVGVLLACVIVPLLRLAYLRWRGPAGKMMQNLIKSKNKG